MKIAWMNKIFLFLTWMLALAACDQNRVYEKNIDIIKDQWAVTDTLIFDFEIPDSSVKYDLLYNVRYSSSYPYYNLYVKYYLLDSTYSEIESKQSNMDIFDSKTGKPLGSGMGDYYDYQILFRDNSEFPYNGIFHLKAIHYMRDEPLEGINSFGLKVVDADTY